MSGTSVMFGCFAAAASSAWLIAHPVASATWTMRRWLWPPSRVRCSAPFSLAKGTPRSIRWRIARGADSTTCSTTRMSLRPAPAIIVSLTCASKLSPSSSTAAIPPWARALALSPSAPLAITATWCRSARLSAAVSPAAPEPTMRTSAVWLTPLLRPRPGSGTRPQGRDRGSSRRRCRVLARSATRALPRR